MHAPRTNPCAFAPTGQPTIAQGNALRSGAPSGHRGRCVAWSPGFHPGLSPVAPSGHEGRCVPSDIHPAAAPAATRRTAITQGGAERNPGLPHPTTPRPNGANGDHAHPIPCALSGLVFILGRCSRGDAPGCRRTPRWGSMRRRPASSMRPNEGFCRPSGTHAFTHPKPSAHALGYLLQVLRTSTPAWTAIAPSRPPFRVFASSRDPTPTAPQGPRPGSSPPPLRENTPVGRILTLPPFGKDSG
jgi:hypothetical protein